MVGGDIVLQLLQRGQSPQSIRILDFQPVTRKDLLKQASGVDFVKTDITSSASVEAAFSKPWPASVAKSPLTVYHTAAKISPGERSLLVYDRVERVNVLGTANVLGAAKTASSDIFVSTASASIALVPAKFWIWPWQSKVEGNLQIVDESDFDAPLRPHGNYFSNCKFLDIL